MKLDRLGDIVAIDTEGTGLSRWHGDRMFSIGACDQHGNKAYARWEVDPHTREVQYVSGDIKRWSKFFESDRKFVFWNGKFDRHMMDAAEMSLPEDWEDAHLALKCVDSGLFTYALKPVSKMLLDFDSSDESDLKEAVKAARREGKAKGWAVAQGDDAVYRDYWLAPPHLNKRYNLADCERTVAWWMVLQDQLGDVQEVYDREMRLQPWLTKMEERGVLTDPEQLHRAERELHGRVEESWTKLLEHAWEGFNPSSPLQVCDLLFNHLELPILKRGKPNKHWPEGQPKTGRAYLEQMNHPAVDSMMEFRRAIKLHQYCVQWADSAIDNVIHTSINAAEAVTGRMSTEKPNLQQVPKRDPELAKLVRSVFIPRPGYVWLCADYSQMELRMLAGLAGEETMIEAFNAGRDIHEETMKRIFDESEWREAPDNCRTKAKNTNFGILYGIGPDKLARELNISVGDAAALISRFKKAFPRVTRFMSESIKLSRTRGVVENPYGRRMTVPRDEPYKGTNYRIQGSGADVIKEAIPRVGEMFEQNELDAHTLLPVHDELVNEVRRVQCRRWVGRAIRDLMEDHGGRFPMPLPVDVDLVRHNWSEKDGEWIKNAA